MTVLLGFVFVIVTIAVTIGSYLLMRWITGGNPEELTKDLAGSVIFRVSALHGLILALVFAQEMVEYQQLKLESSTETNAIADVYFDANRYGAANQKEIQDTLFAYVGTVIDEEWDRLGSDGRLSPDAWVLWDTVYKAVLDLMPETGRQESVRAHMIAQIHKIADTRVKRESHASQPINGMFWFAAIIGVVLISLAYYSYPPKRHNLLLISIFGAFTGLILFFIYSFSNPFSNPGALEPTAHERLLIQLTEARAGAGG